MIIDTELNSAAQIPSKICVDVAIFAEERGFGCAGKGESNSRDPMVLPDDPIEIPSAAPHHVDYARLPRCQ